jgi:hypothetical protein
MVRPSSLALDVLFLFCVSATLITTASGAIRSSYPLAASIPYESFSRRRSLSSRHARLTAPVSFGDNSKYVVQASSRSTTRREKDSGRNARSSSKPKGQNQPATASSDASALATYGDLSPFGRFVAGTVEIAVTTLTEYMTGFAGGYALGTITDIPRLLFRRVEPDARQALLKEMSGRTLRMHTKSFGWARNWAGISAAFGCFRVVAKVSRGGKEDEWTTILSSMAAGAYFARNGTLPCCHIRSFYAGSFLFDILHRVKQRTTYPSHTSYIFYFLYCLVLMLILIEGPQAMVRGAAMYGGLMYLLANLPNNSKVPAVQQDYPVVDF